MRISDWSSYGCSSDLQRGHFLGDVQAHRGAFVDVRRHPQDQADILAIDGLERVLRLSAAARTGIGELAGDERHFLRDLEFGLVVRSAERRVGQEWVSTGRFLLEAYH